VTKARKQSSSVPDRLLSVVVMGTGPNSVEELKTALSQCPDADVMAVNRAICTCPVPITHAVSKHPDHLLKWCARYDVQLVCTNVCAHTIPLSETLSSQYTDKGWYYRQWDFDKPWMEMTSGMFAVKIALELGYKKIYLAGLPLTLGFSSEYEKPRVQAFLRDALTSVKEEFKNVVVPEHYWWRRAVVC